MLELEALAFGTENDEKARFLLMWAVRCYNDIRRQLARDRIVGDAQVRDALCTSPYAGLVERFERHCSATMNHITDYDKNVNGRLAAIIQYVLWAIQFPGRFLREDL
ncbi:hypothetical protein N7488_006436 [Penicillium malachiteum]|nr:hypothetical protein N7488_006436 [Penicillium malachiteum]